MIKNKVEESGLKTIDLTSFFPKEIPIHLDIAPFLFKGLIVREKEFRQILSEHNWENYNNRTVLVFCSADVIIPVWAYMLVVVHLQTFTNDIFNIKPEKWKEDQIIVNIKNMNIEPYINSRVVIKGCADEIIPESAYFEITKILRPIVKSILYGEPCSTVPIFKNK